MIGLAPPDASASSAKGSVVVRTIGLVDQLQVSFTGLEPDRVYDLVLADRPVPPYGSVQTLSTVRGDVDGRAIGHALGPIRKAFIGDGQANGEGGDRRKALLVLPSGGARSRPILVEARR